MSAERPKLRPNRVRIAAPLLLVLISLVAAGSAVWHTPDARLGEVARLESLEHARSICRHWLEEHVTRPFLERCPAGEHVLVGSGDTLRWASRRRPHGFELDLVLASGAHEHAFRAELAVGRLRDCFRYAFVSDLPVPSGFLRARSETVSRFGPGLAKPLGDEDWPDRIALTAPRLLRRNGVAGWRLADELPLRHFGEASPRTDYELFADASPAAPSVRPVPSDEPELCVLVPGDLWLGRQGKTLELDLEGRTLVLFVEGQLYLAGDVELRGVRDRLILIVGREPSEGACVHLGLPGQRAPLSLEASVVARGSLRVHALQTRLRGRLLVEGPISVEEPGATLELVAPGPEDCELRPLPCLPTAPDSGGELRLLRLESLG